MTKRIGPFVLTFALVCGSVIASAQGSGTSKPPANNNGGASTNGCAGGTQGGSTGCKGPHTVKVPTLADALWLVDVLIVAIP